VVVANHLASFADGGPDVYSVVESDEHCMKSIAQRLRQDVATDEVREADRSRVSGPPSSSECMDARTARR
jgi:hypothetical protein